MVKKLESKFGIGLFPPYLAGKVARKIPNLLLPRRQFFRSNLDKCFCPGLMDPSRKTTFDWVLRGLAAEE